MRFTRYPRGTHKAVTPQRLAAARRAVERDREQCGLFPEMMVHKSAEERAQAVVTEAAIWWAEMRQRVAKDWRRARRELRDLSLIKRQGVASYWSTCVFPGVPVYLLELIRETRNGRPIWKRLSVLRRFRLEGMRKGVRTSGVGYSIAKSKRAAMPLPSRTESPFLALQTRSTRTATMGARPLTSPARPDQAAVPKRPAHTAKALPTSHPPRGEARSGGGEAARAIRTVICFRLLKRCHRTVIPTSPTPTS